jgi:gamma-glutamylputrescine oxidase
MTDPLANSYYAATAHPWTPRQAEPGDHDCDVAVIGGGYTGLSAALCCAERGFSVKLIEAEYIGFGASGRNGGQLIPGLRWSMSELERALGLERAQAIFNLCWRDNPVQRRIARHNIRCDLKSGHLEAAWSPADFTDLQKEAEFLDAHYGYASDSIVRDDLGAHINSGIYHGGIYDPQGGHFHPLNYAIGLAKAAEAAGVDIWEGERAALIPGDTTVQLRNSRVKARYIINATDSWMDEIDRDRGRYTIPIMNYNVATAPLSDADALLPSDAAVADSRFVLNYFRLSADKRLIFGGGERYSQTPPTDIAAFVRPHISRVFPRLADVPIDFGWGGAVAVTMNRLPHIGRDGNIFYAHGFSGHGAMTTTLAGEVIAEALAGTASRYDVLASLPSRPFPGGRMLRRPLATLGLLWYALRDRLA